MKIELRPDLKSDLIAWQRETLYIGLMWLRELATNKMKLNLLANAIASAAKNFTILVPNRFLLELETQYAQINSQHIQG